MKWCVVIPVYNNAGTIRDVVARTLAVARNLLVVDDGSTDLDVAGALPDVEVLTLPRNEGKGAAIVAAARLLAPRGFDYMITLDADGQHYPEDIPLFLPLMERNDFSLLIGARDFNAPNVPNSSKFGRRLSNFWFRLETGRRVADTQSGFRAYPLRYLLKVPCHTKRYNAETELLTRCAWAGLEFHDIPIRTHYLPPGERISHFRPFMDNFRISLLHARLIGRRLLPWPQKRLRRAESEIPSFARPKELLLWLLRENSSPEGLAAAAFVGAFLAVLPLIACHTVAILYVAFRLHLNKAMAFLAQQPFQPPLCPFLCIEAGHWMRHGRLLTEFSVETLVAQAHNRIFEWLLGSLVLAPVFAALFAAFVYFIARFVKRKSFKRRTEKHETPLE